MDTKQKIIKEAKLLFGEKGFKGTSLSEIAGAVGIKKPSLYHFFGSKEELYFVVLISIMNEITDIYQVNMDKSKPEDLKYVIKIGLKEGLRIGSGMTTLKNTVKISDPKLEREVLKNYQIMMKAIRDYLKNFKIKDPNFVAQLLVDCQQMYMLRKACGVPELSVDVYTDKLTNLILSYK